MGELRVIDRISLYMDVIDEGHEYRLCYDCYKFWSMKKSEKKLKATEEEITEILMFIAKEPREFYATVENRIKALKSNGYLFGQEESFLDIQKTLDK
ncbi:MAG: hypothetical protein ACXABY_27945 [Candidatus Thorarchaeota archaeon]|jgi:hypothetical protein